MWHVTLLPRAKSCGCACVQQPTCSMHACFRARVWSINGCTWHTACMAAHKAARYGFNSGRSTLYLHVTRVRPCAVEECTVGAVQTVLPRCCCTAPTCTAAVRNSVVLSVMVGGVLGLAVVSVRLPDESVEAPEAGVSLTQDPSEEHAPSEHALSPAGQEICTCRGM